MEPKKMGWNQGINAVRAGRTFQFMIVVLALGASRLSARACVNDSECEDGVACTANRCILGQCVFPDSCPNSSYCDGDEACNHSTGQCVNTPRNCQSPTPLCNETLDTCVECLNNSNCTTPPRTMCSSSGACVQCTVNAHCTDASFCNGTETCNSGTGLCNSGTPVSCPGGQFCSESLDRCVGCENDAQCGDGLDCNGAERCTNDQCGPGTPVSCKECVGGPIAGTACLNNSECRVCVGGSNAGGVCIQASQCPGGTCPAGGTCTGPATYCKEAEVGVECVECLNNANCEDNTFCTSDSCLFNLCNNIPDPMRFCDDGVFCNGSEACNANLTGCQSGPPVSCQKKCFGGTTPGANCSTDGQCGAGGKCVGFCSETFNECVECEVDNQCSNSLFCDGPETCRASDRTCLEATDIDCSSLNTSCKTGFCDEVDDRCETNNRQNGTPCDDGSQCTTVDECQNGICVEDPPLANDPYRCVKLEWRPVPGDPPFPIQVQVGSTFRLALFAVAQGCNVSNQDCPSAQHSAMVGMDVLLDWNPSYLQILPSTGGNPNPQDPCDNGNSCSNCQVCTGGSNAGAACIQQCVGGSNAGGQCYHAAHCPGGSCHSGPVCVGGGNNGLTCLSAGNCPGGSCSSTNKCLGGGACGAPPANNWASSLFPNDCQAGGDAINSPCAGGVPANDGDAAYTAISQIQCNARPALQGCASTAGLHVTTFKFKALALPPGGSTTVDFLPCAGEHSKTQIISAILPPQGYFTDDVLKSMGSPAPVNVVTCTNDATCQDSDACTTDACTGGVCRHTPLPCGDPDACTIDSCVNGLCIHEPMNCGAGNVCYLGTCYAPCSNVSQCNDNIPCTVDTCDTTPPAPIDGVCRHTGDDAVCNNPALFCQGKRCDLTLGCVFDHECLSGNGNPCPTPASCSEANDNCGGCIAPTVVSAGARYLKVTPAAQGTTPVAIAVYGDCADSAVGCVAKYVQNVAGQLGATPVYRRTDLPQASGGWGTVSVHGTEMLAARVFRVHTECNFAGGAIQSAGKEARTWRWADTNNDSIVNITDIQLIVDGFKGLFSATVKFEATNISGAACNLDENVNIIDIAAGVDGFKEIPFACGQPCP